MGSIVGVLSASDPDDGSNAEVLYFVQGWKEIEIDIVLLINNNIIFFSISPNFSLLMSLSRVGTCTATETRHIQDGGARKFKYFENEK